MLLFTFYQMAHYSARIFLMIVLCWSYEFLLVCVFSVGPQEKWSFPSTETSFMRGQTAVFGNGLDLGSELVL
jgi:hypothetical protein